MKQTLTLNRALLGTVIIAILVGLVPAGIALDRRLATALEQKARVDLELAPRMLADRSRAYADAMMMHAKDFAGARGLAEALAGGDQGALLRIIEASRATLGDGQPVIVAADGRVLAGPTPSPEMLERTRRGDMPVEMRASGQRIQNVALAPVQLAGRWIGSAGVASAVDERQAGALSGLTRSDVILVAAPGGSLSATTLDTARARLIIDALRATPPDGEAREVALDGTRYLTVLTPLSDAGSAIFVRDMRDELAILPELRRVAMVTGVGALAAAILLGAILARRVTRPVRLLAGAASAMREGSFDAPLPDSRIEEVARVAERFAEMRLALADRLRELREANDALQDRNARLSALQSDLMQRDRLAATGRLVAQLAHEIRNPVASLRNCLELIRRRVDHDPEAREFVDLAIDELLRMHELAEQMLDVNRPRDRQVQSCLPTAAAREVARLTTAGIPADLLEVRVEGDPAIEAAVAPDALKQVLLNLVQNAREALAAGAEGPVRGARITIAVTGDESNVRIDVRDNGPGVPADLRERIFDPFFTTKSAVHGVGLGLFVAEGLIRGAGGRIDVTDAPEGGALVRVQLPRTTSRASRVGTAGPDRESIT